jgi:4-amino-4-deoxy-L-arabinose transferase-like glycosyltransferase
MAHPINEILPAKRPITDLFTVWVDKHARFLWIAVLGSAVALRALLIWRSPWPYGYTYDQYFQGVEHLITTGHLPTAVDCLQCYHPPLFYALGAVFYWLGSILAGTRTGALEGLSALSLLSACATAWFSIRLLELLRQRGSYLLLASAVVVVFPCLFISSWSAEADGLQTALISAVLYYLSRYDAGPRHAGLGVVVLLGVFCGLAMATKYNGLLALGATGFLLLLRLFTDGERPRTIRDGLIVLALALSIGSWKYMANRQQHGTALFANGTAAEGFAVGHFSHWRAYEYLSLRFREVIDLYEPDAPSGRLTDAPVYYSVPTTLHAMAWTDMSFFSVKSRHGDPSQPYPDKHIPKWLVGAMLVVGMVPSLLATVGFLSVTRRKAFRACTILTLMTIAAYVAWFTGQDRWALKTKYVLFLLPAYAAYLVVGLRVVRQWSPGTLAGLAVFGLLLLIVMSQLFAYAFALGSIRMFPV